MFASSYHWRHPKDDAFPGILVLGLVTGSLTLAIFRNPLLSLFAFVFTTGLSWFYVARGTVIYGIFLADATTTTEVIETVLYDMNVKFHQELHTFKLTNFNIHIMVREGRHPKYRLRSTFVSVKPYTVENKVFLDQLCQNMEFLFKPKVDRSVSNL